MTYIAPIINSLQKHSTILIANRYFEKRVKNCSDSIELFIIFIMMGIICIIFAIIDKLIENILTKTPEVLKKPVQKPKPTSTELDSLLARKKEIDDTSQSYNNPSTFAKYAKMQRQLVKIEKQIQQLSQQVPKQEQQQQPLLQKKSVGKATILRIAIQIGFAILSSQFVIEIQNAVFPLSALVNEKNELNCRYVFLAMKILLKL